MRWRAIKAVPAWLRMRRRVHRAGVGVLATGAMTGCGSASSTLAPAGVEADTIARLFWLMAVGAGVVWVAVVAVALHAARHRGAAPDRRRALRWLVGVGGVAVPTVVLGALPTGCTSCGLSRHTRSNSWCSPSGRRVHAVGLLSASTARTRQ